MTPLTPTGVTPTIEDGELVLRMPSQNVTDYEIESDPDVRDGVRCRIRIGYGPWMEVDRDTWEAVAQRREIMLRFPLAEIIGRRTGINTQNRFGVDMVMGTFYELAFSSRLVMRVDRATYDLVGQAFEARREQAARGDEPWRP